MVCILTERSSVCDSSAFWGLNVATSLCDAVSAAWGDLFTPTIDFVRLLCVADAGVELDVVDADRVVGAYVS